MEDDNADHHHRSFYLIEKKKNGRFPVVVIIDAIKQAKRKDNQYKRHQIVEMSIDH